MSRIADVNTWRKPDRVFDGEYLELDLGDRKVQLWHFGPGNTPGDTIVHVPEVKVAWTGNFLSNELIGNQDIQRFVPGDGPMGKPEAFDRLIRYLWWLLKEVDEALRLGLTETAAIEAISLDRRFLVSRFSPASRVNPLIENFHRVNVLSTYRALVQERGMPAGTSQAAA